MICKKNLQDKKLLLAADFESAKLYAWSKVYMHILMSSSFLYYHMYVLGLSINNFHCVN